MPTHELQYAILKGLMPDWKHVRLRGQGDYVNHRSLYVLVVVLTLFMGLTLLQRWTSMRRQISVYSRWVISFVIPTRRKTAETTPIVMIFRIQCWWWRCLKRKDDKDDNKEENNRNDGYKNDDNNLMTGNLFGQMEFHRITCKNVRFIQSCKEKDVMNNKNTDKKNQRRYFWKI